MAMPRLVALFGIHLIGAFAGFIFSKIDSPLPWMIGPLITTAILTGVPGFQHPPMVLRWAGQLIVASAVALSLSPSAIKIIAADAPYMVASAVVFIACAIKMAQSMERRGILDSTTSLLALLPGGAAEMATLAEKHGGRPELVAISQTLRLTLTISVVPFLLLAIEPMTRAGSVAASAADGSAIAALALALFLAVLLNVFGIANAFFVGPLIGVGALASIGFTSGSLPHWLTAGGQILLGVSLGAMLRPLELIRMGRYLRIAMAFSVALVLLGLGLAGLAAVVGISGFPQMALAMSAGGVAEMAVAATNFGLEPAYVSAYHLTRIFIIVPFAERLLRFV